MDIEQYRKQCEEELDNALKQQTNYRDFLDKSRSVEERLNIFQSAYGEKEQDAIDESINLIQDKNEDTQIRISALSSITNDIGNREDLMDMVLSLLKDDSEPINLRKEAFKSLKLCSFFSPKFNSKRSNYLDVMRYIVDDKDEELHDQAMELLAIEKDVYLQQSLMEGLRNPSQAKVVPEKAMELLSYDIHADYYDVAKEMVRNPPNILAKREAIRILASDPSAKDLLIETLRNKQEYKDIRQACAVSLHSLDPSLFQDQAKQILNEDDDYDDIQATCITALDQFADPSSLSQDYGLSQRVEHLKQKSKSEELNSAIDGYTSKYKK